MSKPRKRAVVEFDIPDLPDHYVLAGKRPVLQRNFLKYLVWNSKADRRVAKTIVSPLCEVSTVFVGIGIDPAQPPILFETQIRGGLEDGLTTRTSTWAKALKAHKEAVVVATIGRESARLDRLCR